jgi:hypothetical protein
MIDSGGSKSAVVSVPLTPVKTGISRLLADNQPRSSGHVKAPKALIPKLIVRLYLKTLLPFGPLRYATSAGT